MLSLQMLSLQMPSLPVSRLLGVLFVLLGLSIGPVNGQSITPDRPGLGDGASTLEQGTLQAEMGYVFTHTSTDIEIRNANGEPIDDGVDVSTHTLGQLLVRYGMTNAIEVRGGIGSIAWVEQIAESGTEFEAGYDGASLGTKIRLLQTPVATLSGLAILSVPLGSAFSSSDDRARQEVKVAFDGALGDRISISVNGGASFFYDDGGDTPFTDRELEWLFIPTLSVSATDALGLYAGYGGFYNDSLNRNVVEAGTTYRLDPNMQVDVNAGRRVDESADPSFFLGAGFAYRL